jgi:PAS domain S-box-containing protein
VALPELIFRAAFEQAHQPMIILNEYGIPGLWNQAFEELFIQLAGFMPDRLAAPLFDWLSEDDSSRFPYYITEMRMGRMGAASIESPVRTVDGKRLWLRTTINLILGDSKPGGRQEAWIWCAFHDISDQKNREQDLRSAKEEAEKATITKSQFLANMSHEIRTPIQTILGMTELLGETSLDKEQLDYIRTVRFSADVLLGLINDILDFSKIEAGKLDLECVEFDLRSVLRQSVELIILDAHKKELEVILDIDDDLPASISGDPGRLRQIVLNLFKNAVKFTRQGEIAVTVTTAPGEAGQLAMRLTVADSGIGVPEDLRSRLFTPFTQASPGISVQGGTGLGLAISRHLVGLMHGRMWYEPNRPAGSIFGFIIPLRATSTRHPAQRRHLPGSVRTLAVDDNRQALAQLLRTGKSFGLRIDGAISGLEAFAAMKTAGEDGDPYALCLIDQNMPEMDGWRLAAEVSGDRSINAARLVLLVPKGAIGPETKMKLLQWFNGYAAKPLDPDELYDVIQRALSDEVDLAAADGENLEELPVVDDGLGMSVLLAEDHLVNQELFATLLQKMGCQVGMAGNGAEAVEMAAKHYYDLILMDIFMPVMDGYQAAKALRAQGFQRPIIAVTASAIKGERDKCFAAGMNDVLVKPFKKKDLEAILEFWSGRLGPSAQVRQPGHSTVPPATAADPAMSETASWDRDIFDFEGLVETFLGQRDKVLDLLGRFITKTKVQITDMEAAMAAEDTRTLREITHSIKGAAWNLTARILGDSAKLLEDAARDGELQQFQASFPAFVACFEEFNACVRYWVDQFRKGR